MNEDEEAEIALQARVADGLGTDWTAAVVLLCGPAGRTFSTRVGSADPERTIRLSSKWIFDLASLTKVFTATATLRLIARGALSLSTPVSEFGFPFAGVEVRHLLTHTAGLPVSARLHRSPYPPENIWEDLRNRRAEVPPGTRLIYTDVGYIILGSILEMASGDTLTRLIQTDVLNPLGLDSVSFGPRPDAVPTELDPWRGRRLRGEVHDESASVLGGAAGHAGLFGGAPDLVRLLETYASPHAGFLPEVLRLAAIRERARDGQVRWGLGWKLRSEAPDAPEQALSESAFGHFGFTGVSVWHDPQRGLSVCLLTNRVYFGRDPRAIYRLRRDVMELAVRWCDAEA